MSGKKLINSAESVVDEALEGLTLLHPGLRRIRGHRVILREQVQARIQDFFRGGKRSLFGKLSNMSLCYIGNYLVK